MRVYDDGECQVLVERDGNKILIRAGRGYSPHVDKLAILKDTGNNLKIKLYSNPDKKIKLDYAEAEYVYLALKQLYEYDPT